MDENSVLLIFFFNISKSDFYFLISLPATFNSKKKKKPRLCFKLFPHDDAGKTRFGNSFFRSFVDHRNNSIHFKFLYYYNAFFSQHWK